VTLSPGPSWDDWDLLAWWLDFRSGRAGLASLWQPHNEHRIVLTRLLLAGLGSLGLGTQALALVGYGLFAVTFWLLTPLLLETAAPWPPRTRWLFLLATSAFGCSWVQWQNYTVGIQVCWAISLLGIVLAARASGPTRGTTWGAAGGLALAYLGNAVWIALVPLVLGRAAFNCWCARTVADRRRAVLGLLLRALLLALLLALYVHGIAGPAATRGAAFALGHPLASLRFLLRFYGNPFAAGSPVWQALAVAAGALFAAGTVLLVAAGRRGHLWRAAPGLRAFALGLLATVHAAALVVALGRASHAAGAAFADRYSSIMVLGWLVVLCGTLSLGDPAVAAAPRRPPGPATTVAVRVLPMAVLGLGLLVSAGKLHRLLTATLPRQAAASACLAEVLADERLLASRRECLAPLYPDPQRLVAIARRLRSDP
jgi:hypothetical protein